MIARARPAREAGRRHRPVARGDRELPRSRRRGGRRGGPAGPDRPALRRPGRRLEPRRASSASARTTRVPAGLSGRLVRRRRRHELALGPRRTWPAPRRRPVRRRGRPAVARRRRARSAGAARSIVLLGDPQPAAAGLAGDPSRRAPRRRPSSTCSAGAATIAPDRGLFLETTYRLHPDVNAFISDAFYEGRLEPDAGERDARTSPAGCRSAATGMRFVAGCRTPAAEPARPRRRSWSSPRSRRSMGRPWTDREGRPAARSDVAGRPRRRPVQRPGRGDRERVAQQRLGVLPTSAPSTSSRAARRRSRSTR